MLDLELKLGDAEMPILPFPPGGSRFYVRNTASRLGFKSSRFSLHLLTEKIITYLAHVESHEEKSDFRPNTGQRQLQSILVNETNGSEGQACHSKQLSETFLRKAQKSRMLALEASDSKPAWHGYYTRLHSVHSVYRSVVASRDCCVYNWRNTDCWTHTSP